MASLTYPSATLPLIVLSFEEELPPPPQPIKTTVATLRISLEYLFILSPF